MPDLSAAVFILHQQKPFSPRQFMGRAAQKLFLLMLHRLSELADSPNFSALAQELHDTDAHQPYTVSDLFPNGTDRCWMRVTALEPPVCAVLMALVQTLPGRAEVDGWYVDYAVMSDHDWAGQERYDTLVQTHWKPTRQLTLDYMTPSALKSVGLYRPFPDPALVFRLLYERLLKLGAFRLPFTPDSSNVRIFADHFIEVTDYDVTCVKLTMKGPIPAFQGRVTYRILRENDAFGKSAQTRRDKEGDTSLIAVYDDISGRYDQYASLINLLAAFAFYSGVGVKTAQGMGMVRRVQ